MSIQTSTLVCLFNFLPKFQKQDSKRTLLSICLYMLSQPIGNSIYLFNNIDCLICKDKPISHHLQTFAQLFSNKGRVFLSKGCLLGNNRSLLGISLIRKKPLTTNSLKSQISVRKKGIIHVETIF